MKGYPKINSVTGILVAGGKSRRMGQDKRFMKLGGRTLLDLVLRGLEASFEEVMVVLAEPVPELPVSPHKVIYDAIPNAGSFGGLYTGLRHATTSRSFVIACDMPFLNPEFIHHLVDLEQTADVVMARLSTGLQPMHAVYSQRCLPIMEEMAGNNDLKIQNLAYRSSLKVRFVEEPEIAEYDPRFLSFQNINTRAEFDRAESLLAVGSTIFPP